MQVRFYLKRPKDEKEKIEKKKSLSKVKKEANSGIYATISYNSQRIKYYLTLSINPSFWNFTAQRAKETSKFESYVEFNNRLQEIKRQIEKAFYNYQNNNESNYPTADQLRSVLDKEFKKNTSKESNEKELKTFWGFFNDFIERCQDGSRLHLQKHTRLAKGTINNFKNLARHLKGYEKWIGKKLEFGSIDINFHNQFTKYQNTVNKVVPNTTGKLITNLKVVLQEALEAGVNTNTTFQHRKFKSYQTETFSVYLTEYEIEQLLKLDLTQNIRLEKIRDIFIIGCFTGLRFSDLQQLSLENVRSGIAEIRQLKTGNMVYIPLRSVVKMLFEKYKEGGFPRISNQKFNSYLKEVCKLCPALQTEVALKVRGVNDKEIRLPKYEFVSSHTGRRSFATNEYLAGELSVFEIRSLTGHRTEKAFFRYIRMTPKENAANVAKKFEEREKNSILFGTPMMKAV